MTSYPFGRSRNQFSYHLTNLQATTNIEPLILTKDQLRIKNLEAALEVATDNLLIEKMRSCFSDLRYDIAKPLIDIGASIRQRFLEQTIRDDYYGSAGFGGYDHEMIEAGNRAAHRGDYAANRALFDLGLTHRDEHKHVFAHLYETAEPDLAVQPVGPPQPARTVNSQILDAESHCASINNCLLSPFYNQQLVYRFYNLQRIFYEVLEAAADGLDPSEKIREPANMELEQILEDMHVAVKAIVEFTRNHTRRLARRGINGPVDSDMTDTESGDSDPVDANTEATNTEDHDTEEEDEAGFSASDDSG